MTTLHIAQHDTCPECGTQWAITNNTSRIIAIYSRQQDRTTAWHCPDCGMEWDRDATLEPNPEATTDTWTNPTTGHSGDCGCITCHITQGN